MTASNSQLTRVLAIAPSSRGFGYALMGEDTRLVDWGVKTVKGDKNSRSLSNVANLVSLYQPNVLVLEDSLAQGSRRNARVRALIDEIVLLGKGAGIEVAQFSRKQLGTGYFSQEKATKYALAENIARRFPQELGFRVPRKRRPWMSEDYRMDIFDAVALAEHFIRSRKPGA